MKQKEDDKRKTQRRKMRTGRCRRCDGARVVPTGEPDEVLMGGEVGTPVKPCSCVANVKRKF
jgi:hypothetical protein